MPQVEGVTVELKPETERLVREEIRRGHFRSLDEIIVQGVTAWHEKHKVAPAELRLRKPLYDLLTQAPFAGSELAIDRQKEYPRPVDLS